MKNIAFRRILARRISYDFSHRLNGFTLQELLVVLVIVGILILLALPNLMPLISRTKSIEAQMSLKHVHTLQRSHFMQYGRYSSDLSSIGFEQEILVDAGGNANYLVSLEQVEGTSFVAQARSVVDFDGDGQINVWQINQDGDLVEVQSD